jgi:integrase
MTLENTIRDHLAASGLSMRALSRQAGLNPKAVSDILKNPGCRPNRTTIDALARAIGSDLPDAGPRPTYAALIAALSTKTGDPRIDRRNATRASRLRRVVLAAGWTLETEEVDRRRILDRFAAWSPASLGLSPGSFATYKADVLAAIAVVGGARRKVGMRDVSGLYREIYDAVQKSELKYDLKMACGSFFFFLDQEGLLPADISTSLLEEYFRSRLATSNKTATNCRKHVKRMAALCNTLSSDPAFARFQFPKVIHPFQDARDKYGVEESLFEEFLNEFDGRVARWAAGEESRDGLSYEAFLSRLDGIEHSQSTIGKKALLKRKKSGRKTTKEERRSQGFLIGHERWSATTIRNRRGLLLAGAKALYAATGYRIESVSEFTDPDVVESVLEAVQAGNADGEFPSGYAATIGKTLKKLARDYVARDEQDIREIAAIIGERTTTERGIARRNKAKLRELVGNRAQALIDLGDILIDEVNREVDRRARRSRGVARKDLLDVELARDIMCAVASDIFLARAPRKENVLGIRLPWISWRGDRATIRVPSVEVKGRTSDDPDLVIPLGPNESRRLRLYLDKVRPLALQEGEETNPFLFPAQRQTIDGCHAPFDGLLNRLMRHAKKIAGVHMNPHLYRHFVGWLWLKADPNRLPDVQRLLGHKSLETTLRHYAEIDEDLALDRWQQFLADRKSRKPGSLKKGK